LQEKLSEVSKAESTVNLWIYKCISLTFGQQLLRLKLRVNI